MFFNVFFILKWDHHFVISAFNFYQQQALSAILWSHSAWEDYECEKMHSLNTFMQYDIIFITFAVIVSGEDLTN